MSTQIKRIGTWIKFSIIFLLVVGGTLALVAYGQGYLYDRESGSIISGGLVLIDSEPNRASVSVGGSTIGSTPQRLRRPIGEYDIVLSRDGYRSWHKRVHIEEGSLINAEYPFLIPNNVVTTTMLRLNQPQLLSQSPDAEFIVFVDGHTGDELRLVNIDSNDSVVAFSLNESGYTGADILDIEWSKQSDWAFLHIDYEGGRRALLLEADSSQFTLIDDYQIDEPRNIEFGPDETVYLLDGSQLIVQEVGAEISTIAAENVRSFGASTDAVFYITNDNEVFRVGSAREEPLHRLGRSSTVDIDTLTYRDERTVLLHNRDTQQLSLLRESDQYRTTTLPLRKTETISISPSQRFIVSYNGSRFMTYDLRTDDLYEFSLDDEPSTSLSWFSNHHMLMSISGGAVMMEFDGANIEHITTDSGFGVFGYRDDLYVYSIGVNTVTDQPVLQRSLLE